MSRPRDSARFEAAFLQHSDSVFRFLAYRVPSRELAEDLTQLTFEKALRSWPRYDPAKAGVLTWLLAIARNALIDHTRAAKGEIPLTDAQTERLVTEDNPNIGPSSELAQALAGLGDREREILGLRFGADLTGQEIADLTGLSLANVQQILSRTLRRLRDALDPQT